MNETRRALLAALEDGPVAGPELADRLGVSRAAVWKQVESLREDGFGVESDDDGYRVTDVPEYGEAAIAFGLDAPFEVEYHDSLASTNDRGRELAVEGRADVAVVADEQTGGRGRLEREWTAPSGGVWVSLVLRPDRPPAHVPAFTLAAAVATTRAAREAGVDAHIKWPNDVLVGDGSEGDAEAARRGGRKLAGILTEMEGEADRVSWVVVGIGVNANVDVAEGTSAGRQARSDDAEDLPPGATSIREEAGDVSRRAFVQRLLEEFHALREDEEAVLPAWREYASTLGRRVRVETPGGTVEGEAVDVRFPGALVVRTDDGAEELVHAGDCEHLRSE